MMFKEIVQVVFPTGFFTGKCVPSGDNQTEVCEMYGWCPEELALST